VDSAFPAGGFAHSGGFEATWQAGWIASSDDMRSFVTEYMLQLSHGILPFVAAAARGVDFADLDAFLDSLLSNHVTNRASRLQGMTFLSTVEKVFGGPSIEELRECTLRSDAPTHHAVAFGTVMRILNVNEEESVRIFAFMSMRGVLSAAVRCGAIGPLQAQRLQNALSDDVEDMIVQAMTIQWKDACQTAPLFDMWQMMQDRLYSRLFQS
jgi:urease accessory protein